jgi:hypothetical protein
MIKKWQKNGKKMIEKVMKKGVFRRRLACFWAQFNVLFQYF